MNAIEEARRAADEAHRIAEDGKKAQLEARHVARVAKAAVTTVEQKVKSMAEHERYAKEVATIRDSALPTFRAAPLRVFDDRDKLCAHWEICRMKTPWLSHNGARPDAPAHYFPIPKHPQAGPTTCPSCDADVWKKCVDGITN